MRNLSDVIEQILLFVPQSEIGLQNDLKRALNSSLYASPEMQSYFWCEAEVALNENFLNNVKDKLLPWQKAVITIWNHKE